jgi:hypothetical protein
MHWRIAHQFKPMRRVQLFEFLDQSWLPGRLRTAVTRYLTATYATTPFPVLWAAILARALDRCQSGGVVDLGSGAGGPMELVLDELARLKHWPQVTLTDLYPEPTSAACSTPSISYWPEPVSAARVPPQLQGLRTLFVTFHHFAPPLARAVLQDAFRQRQPICIFEATSRTGPAIAASFLIPAMVLLLTPSVRPITMYQIVFTYLIPVIPLLAVWDGLVSQLRTYSIAELKELAADFTAPEYEWEFGLIEAKGILYKTCYLIGRPTLVE